MKWGIETEDQADYSLLHLGDARARAGFRTLPEMTSSDYRWPDNSRAPKPPPSGPTTPRSMCWPRSFST